MSKLLQSKHLIKLILLCSAIVLLVVIVVMFFKIGYLPIFGNIIAEKKMSDYANTQIESKFDLLNGKYISTLDNEYSLSYELQFNTIHDEQMSTNANDVAKNDYQTIIEEFPANLEFPDGIIVWTSINADDYSIKPQKLYLLGIYNTNSLTQEESLKMPADIAQTFIGHMGKVYNFTSIQLIYADKNGMYEISIPDDTFDVLVYQELLLNTKRYPEERLPLDYLEWLEQQSK